MFRTVEAPSAEPLSKLFILHRGLAVGSLRRDFQLCCVPDGYAFAADGDLHFGPLPKLPMSAASTAHADTSSSRVAKSGRLRAIESDVAGVWVAQLMLPRLGVQLTGAAEQRQYATFHTPPCFHAPVPPNDLLAASVRAEDGRQASSGQGCRQEASELWVVEDVVHGPCVCCPPPSNGHAMVVPEFSGEPAPARYRLRDGALLPPNEGPGLTLVAHEVIAGAIYVLDERAT